MGHLTVLMQSFLYPALSDVKDNLNLLYRVPVNQQLSHKKKVMTIQMTILMRMTSKSQLEISKPLQLQGTLLHCFSIH